MILSSLSLTETLIQGLHRDISSADRYRASLHLLDWLGCSLAVIGDELHQKVSRSLEIEGLNPYKYDSAISLADRITSLAMLGNQLEMDDVHRTSILHPGPVICPVALSVAIINQNSTTELLDALVAGYETTIRVGRAIGASHYQYFHNTSTCGVFGAATAASLLYHLDDQQWAFALGNAGTRTGGLWQMRHEPVDSKSIHNSQAAHAGWQAALFARQGIAGPRLILEGEQGVFAALSTDPSPEIVNQEAPHWLINEVSFKPWPACRHAHAPVDAIYPELNKLDINQINSIEVHTYADAVKFCDRPAPETKLQAKFSIQHAIAVLITSGHLSLNDFEKNKRDDKKIVSWRNRVSVVVSDEFQTAYPQRYGAKVILRLKDNQIEEFICRDAWGDPENPMTESEVVEKASRLMAYGGVEEKSAQDLIDAVLRLSKVDTCDELKGALNDLKY